MEDRDTTEARLDPKVDLEHYLRARSKGTGHNLAIIIASRAAPAMDRQDERWGTKRDPEAQARGINAVGKYQAGLARFPGDPQAVVSSRGDARRVAEKNGWTISKGPNNEGQGSTQSRRAQAQVSL